MKKLVLMFMVIMMSVFVVPANVYALEQDDEDEVIFDWHEDNPYIRHGGGNVQNLSIPNSVKAFQNSVDKGYTVIEMDFSFTTDGKLVCIHDWKKGNMTYKQFKKNKLLGKYKRATAQNVVDMLIDNPEIYLVVDAKEGDVLKVYSKLREICDITGDLNVMDQVIPQFYKESELERLKEIYDFKDYIFTLYRLKNCKTLDDYKRIADFCEMNQVDVVTIPKAKLNKSIVKVFKKKNIKVYTHTVNTVAQRKKYLKMGVSGFYTDKL